MSTTRFDHRRTWYRIPVAAAEVSAAAAATAAHHERRAVALEFAAAAAGAVGEHELADTRTRSAELHRALAAELREEGSARR